MTQSLPNVAVQQFRDTFQNTYQAMRKLADTTQMIRGVVGDAYKFKLAGLVDMHLRGAAQSDIPQSDVSYSAPTITFDNYILNLPTDIFDQAEVNANERQNLVNVHAKAIGRREDQFKIDALNASATTKLVPDVGTNMTVAKLRETSELLNDDEVPDDGRHIAIHASGLRSLLAEAETTSTDFSTVRSLMNGEINSFMGFQFHTLGNRAIGGLPKVGDIRTSFAWHMDSTGMAFGIDPTITVDWDPRIQSWITISKMRAGAVAIDNLGIVKISTDES